MFKKHMHKAMTLAEVTVVIGVIGVLAAIMIPLIKHTLPTKEEEMHKKMTYLVEQISSGMFENESYYPQTKDVSKFGFLNTDAVIVDGQTYGGNQNQGEEEQENRQTKFCKLFAKQFKSVDNQAIVCPDNLDGDPTFRSEDGVDWWIPKTTFTEDGNGQKPGYVKIKIDVNSRDKGGNCGIGDANCKRPDTFYYYIKANGAVTLADPLSLSGDNYRILPRLRVKNIDGTSTNYDEYSITDIGQLCIVRLNDDGEFVTENISCESDSFIGLTPNAKYRVFAVSFSKYSIDKGKPYNENIFGVNVSDIRYRDIKTDRKTKYAEFIFNQPEMHSINVNIISGLIIDNAENYSISDIFEFAGLNTDCAYKDVGENQGDFAKESVLAHGADNYFKYVGPFKGKYKYQCTNESNEEEQPLNFGLNGENKLTIGGLSIGNYQIVITPKEGYCVDPEDDGNFIKRIRLGNKDETVKMKVWECSIAMAESCAPGRAYRLFEFDGKYTYDQAQNLCSKVGGSLPDANLLYNTNIFQATSENSMDMHFPGGVIGVSIETDPETGGPILVYNSSIYDDSFMASIDFWTADSGKYIEFGECVDAEWMKSLIGNTNNYTNFSNVYNMGLETYGTKHNVLCVVPDSECPVEGCIAGVGYIYQNNKSLTYNNAETACAEHGESFEIPIDYHLNKLWQARSSYSFLPTSGNYWGAKVDSNYTAMDFSNGNYSNVTSSNLFPSLCIGNKDGCPKAEINYIKEKCEELNGTYFDNLGCLIKSGRSDANYFECINYGTGFNLVDTTVAGYNQDILYSLYKNNTTFRNLIGSSVTGILTLDRHKSCNTNAAGCQYYFVNTKKSQCAGCTYSSGYSSFCLGEIYEKSTTCDGDYIENVGCVKTVYLGKGSVGTNPAHRITAQNFYCREIGKTYSVPDIETLRIIYAHKSELNFDTSNALCSRSYQRGGSGLSYYYQPMCIRFTNGSEFTQNSDLKMNYIICVDPTYEE